MMNKFQIGRLRLLVSKEKTQIILYAFLSLAILAMLIVLMEPVPVPVEQSLLLLLLLKKRKCYEDQRLYYSLIRFLISSWSMVCTQYKVRKRSTRNNAKTKT